MLSVPLTSSLDHLWGVSPMHLHNTDGSMFSAWPTLPAHCGQLASRKRRREEEAEDEQPQPQPTYRQPLAVPVPLVWTNVDASAWCSSFAWAQAVINGNGSADLSSCTTPGYAPRTSRHATEGAASSVVDLEDEWEGVQQELSLLVEQQPVTPIPSSPEWMGCAPSPCFSSSTGSSAPSSPLSFFSSATPSDGLGSEESGEEEEEEQSNRMSTRTMTTTEAIEAEDDEEEEEKEEEDTRAERQDGLCLTLMHKPRGSKGIYVPLASDAHIRVTKGKGKRLRIIVDSEHTFEWDDMTINLIDLTTGRSCNEEFSTCNHKSTIADKAGSKGTKAEVEVTVNKLSSKLHFQVIVAPEDERCKWQGYTTPFTTHNNGKDPSIRALKRQRRAEERARRNAMGKAARSRASRK